MKLRIAVWFIAAHFAASSAWSYEVQDVVDAWKAIEEESAFKADLILRPEVTVQFFVADGKNQVEIKVPGQNKIVGALNDSYAFTHGGTDEGVEQIFEPVTNVTKVRGLERMKGKGNTAMRYAYPLASCRILGSMSRYKSFAYFPEWVGSATITELPSGLLRVDGKIFKVMNLTTVVNPDCGFRIESWETTATDAKGESVHESGVNEYPDDGTVPSLVSFTWFDGGTDVTKIANVEPFSPPEHFAMLEQFGVESPVWVDPKPWWYKWAWAAAAMFLAGGVLVLVKALKKSHHIDAEVPPGEG